jgi:Flp pilus assembly protein TadG
VNIKMKLKQVPSDTRGSVAMIFALSITAIFGGVALAIDLNRAVTAGTKLAQVLDAAALAGAKLLDQDVVSDSDVSARVQSFVSAQPAILGISPSTFLQLPVGIDRNTNTVTVVGKGKIQTRFASIIGFNTMDIAKSSAVTYKMKDVELALVMDTTGSMAEVPAGDTKTKIESLKTAADIVVDTLYGQAINDRGIRIAIAPFSSAVNAGSYASDAVQQSSSTYSPYYSSFAPPSSYDKCAVERTGSDNATDASPSSGGKLRSLTSVGDSSNSCPAAAIMPLSGRSKKDDIKSTIANFAPNGSTAGHIGIAWGWYLLSPNWSGIFSGASAPGPYNNTNVSKSVVLMTDGVFNTSYLTGQPAGSAAASTESYTQFDSLCTAMKAKGITIYTIGFGLTDPTAQTKLSACASTSANFFPAANGTELQTAFSTIVAKLNALRVAR